MIWLPTIVMVAIALQAVAVTQAVIQLLTVSVPHRHNYNFTWVIIYLSSMKKKITITLEDFEGISETQSRQLIGGFSKSFSGQVELSSTLVGNNCQGGNCVQGCGSDNNLACNYHVGCGTTK
jgi:hypothetical protein